MQAEKLWITAVVGAAAFALLKQWRPELAPLLLLASVGAAAGLCLQGVNTLLNGASSIPAQGDTLPALTVLIKCTGLCVIAGICGDICRDSGAAALASAVETGGRVLALTAAMPLFHGVAALAVSLLQKGEP